MSGVPDALPADPAVTARRIEELGRVVLAYSEITEKLQTSHDRLTQTVRRLQSELGEKNRELERRNRLSALGEMAAGMAHEIRNPLAGMQLYATMLSDDLADRPENQAVVEKIRKGVRRLEALVSSVLQFSREITASKQRSDLAAIVREACELARARDPGVTVEFVSPEELSCDIDANLMTQAVLNLACNAVDAAGPGGSVRVEVEASGVAAVRVLDSGPGIAAEHLDKIFNPFFTTKDGGTGLGLSIVHRIVEAHGGLIRASNREGGGACFEIRL
jgi:signal transduction histidine kinase